MKRLHKASTFLVLALLLLLAGVGRAQVGGELEQSAVGAAESYGLSWWTMDGGGYTFSTDDSYSLGGTAGQPDAGLLTGGDYTLGGGFWGGAAVTYNIHLPLVVRNYQ